MKIGLVVSTEDALPSVYVVYRDDLGNCIDRCAELVLAYLQWTVNPLEESRLRKVFGGEYATYSWRGTRRLSFSA